MAAAARRVPPERPAPVVRVERMKQRLRENLSRNLLRLRAVVRARLVAVRGLRRARQQLLGFLLANADRRSRNT
jgi:bifunctional ADP-heptose synthase (sugar kinase/adenylyltransferase)